MWVATANNSFYKNPEDISTGSAKRRAVVQPVALQQRFSRVHRNDLENIPLFLALAAAWVFAARPHYDTARFYMLLFTVTRFLHTIWYSAGGSHELRATFYSANVFAMVGICAQLLVAVA